MKLISRLPRRLRAPLVHLLVSASVAALAGGVVFWIWYPPPYAALAGGLGLFGLLVTVDVVMGPMLTAVAASPRKPVSELRRDLALIVLLQGAAFAYGLHVIALARPVYLAFEVDRFRVVLAADIETEALRAAPAGLRSLPWLGPRQIAAVRPTRPEDQIRAIELGLAGFDLSLVPEFWREYPAHAAEAWNRARPLKILLEHYPQQISSVARIEKHARQDVGSLRFLPVVSRRESWSAVVAGPDARIVGFLRVDGFI